MITLETEYEPIKQPLQNNIDDVAECIIGNNKLKSIVNDSLYHKVVTVIRNFNKTLNSLYTLIDAQKYKLVIHDHDFGADINMYIYFEIRKNMEPRFLKDKPRYYLNQIKQDMKPYVGKYGQLLAIAQNKQALVLGLNINEIYNFITQHNYKLGNIKTYSGHIFNLPFLFFGFNTYQQFNPTVEIKHSTDLMFSTAVAWYSFSGESEYDQQYDNNSTKFHKTVEQRIRQEERFLTVKEFNLWASRINLKLKTPIIINTNTIHDIYIRKLIDDGWFIKPKKLRFVEYMDNLYKRAWRQDMLNRPSY